MAWYTYHFFMTNPANNPQEASSTKERLKLGDLYIIETGNDLATEISALRTAQKNSTDKHEKEEIAWRILSLTRTLNDVNLRDMTSRAKEELADKNIDPVLRKKLEEFLSNSETLEKRMKDIRARADAASKKSVLSFLSQFDQIRAVAEMKESDDVSSGKVAGASVKQDGPVSQASESFIKATPEGGNGVTVGKVAPTSPVEARPLPSAPASQSARSEKKVSATKKPKDEKRVVASNEPPKDTKPQKDKEPPKGGEPQKDIEPPKEEAPVPPKPETKAPSVDFTKESEHVKAALIEVRKKNMFSPLNRADVQLSGANPMDPSYALIRQPDGEYYLWTKPEGGKRMIFRLDAQENIVSSVSIDPQNQMTGLKGPEMHNLSFKVPVGIIPPFRVSAPKK